MDQPHPRVAPLAALLLTALLVAGCSDDPSEPAVDGTAVASAPVDATPQDFCAAYDQDLGAMADGSDDADLADLLRTSAASLADVGTPDDIPDDARAGFVVFVSATGGATAKEAAALAGASSAGQVASALDVTGDDSTALAAFTAYVAGTCFVTGA